SDPALVTHQLTSPLRLGKFTESWAQSGSAGPHGFVHQPLGLLRQVPDKHCSSTKQSSPIPKPSNHPSGRQTGPVDMGTHRRPIGQVTPAGHFFTQLLGNMSATRLECTQSW